MTMTKQDDAMADDAMARRSFEPILWMLFSAGGVLSALLLPVLLFLFGIAFPLGWGAAPSQERLLMLMSHPITRMGAFILCLLSLLHWAHRFRYTLYDGLQIKHLHDTINIACYGAAIAGSMWAAYVLWRIP
jgi:fumarate reductase subunit D